MILFSGFLKKRLLLRSSAGASSSWKVQQWCSCTLHDCMDQQRYCNRNFWFSDEFVETLIRLFVKAYWVTATGGLQCILSLLLSFKPRTCCVYLSLLCIFHHNVPHLVWVYCFAFFAGKQVSATITFCSCETEAETLIRYNLWPATPTKPRVVFAFSLLEWHEAMLLEAKVPTLAFCHAIRWMNKMSPRQEVKLLFFLWSNHKFQRVTNTICLLMIVITNFVLALSQHYKGLLWKLTLLMIMH